MVCPKSELYENQPKQCVIAIILWNNVRHINMDIHHRFIIPRESRTKGCRVVLFVSEGLLEIKCYVLMILFNGFPFFSLYSQIYIHFDKHNKNVPHNDVLLS